MRVGIATDHSGFALKEELLSHLREAQDEVVDFGAFIQNPDDDYPDFVIPLAEALAEGRVERGIAICGSGVGASVCANKIPGIRAAVIPDHFSARQGVEDDHINIVCLGGRRWGRRWTGTWYRRSWRLSLAKPNATCAGSRKSLP